MIIYFSGTGNSRFAAEFLAEKLGDTVFDAGKQIKKGETGTFSSETPLIFVAPIYGWRLPHLFSSYIQSAEFSGNRNAYFVLTCGSDIGDAGKYAEDICKVKELYYQGILEVVMPENYIAMFNAPGYEESVRIVEKAKPVLCSGAECIAARKPFPAPRKRVGDSLKSGIVNELFCKFFVKADPFYAKEGCIECGKCVSACPFNNIQLVDGRPVWGKDCTHCMACICGCPAEVIEYGKKSQGKPRYQCPAF